MKPEMRSRYNGLYERQAFRDVRCRIASYQITLAMERSSSQKRRSWPRSMLPGLSNLLLPNFRFHYESVERNVIVVQRYRVAK